MTLALKITGTCILFFVLMTTNIYACSCATPSGFVSEIIGDRIVVRARAIENKLVTQPDAVMKSNWLNATKRLQVGDAFGADIADEIDVLYDATGTSCSISPGLGGPALEWFGRMDDGRYVTGYCSRPRIPEISILEYLEDGIDVFIPNRQRCESAEIEKAENKTFGRVPDTPIPDCTFWSDKARKDRLERRRMKWDNVTQKRKEYRAIIARSLL